MSFNFIFIMYMICINIYGFIIMAADKRKARKHQWRVPEARLWLIAIIGGPFGSYLSMKCFHHKTKHTLFMIGMPFLCLVYAVIIIIIFL